MTLWTRIRNLLSASDSSLCSRRLIASDAASLIGLAVLVVAGGHFAVLCFRAQWGGDFQMYCAAVSRLYADFTHPQHEALNVAGGYSALYSPFIVACAAVGRLLQLTPYRALQLAGVMNIGLWLGGTLYFFKRWSAPKAVAASAAGFVFASLFLRWHNFGWSSELSVLTLQWSQAYPSTFASALALFTLGALHDYARRLGLRQWGILCLSFALLLINHLLTASWVFGLMGLYCAHRSWQRKSGVPLLGLLAVLGVALLLASAWPYGSFWGQGSLTSGYEPERFGESPLTDLLNLYLLAVPCALWLAWRRRLDWFWICGFVATLMALQVWRALGISFGNRYALFMGFFAQVVVAQTLAYALMFACRLPLELGERRAAAKADRYILPVLALAILTGWLWAPVAKQIQLPAARGGAYSFRELWNAPAPHAAFYARFSALEPTLQAGDTVLMSIGRSNFDLVSVTGAGVVAAPHALRVPDAAARVRDVKAFLQPKASDVTRRATLQRYGVSHVLLDRAQAPLVPAMTRLLGAPRVTFDGYTLFKVNP